MKRFKTFVAEGKYPTWVRVTVGALVLRIRNLSFKVQREKDPVKQNELISQQNKLISYITGLGIGEGKDDVALLKKLKSFIK